MAKTTQNVNEDAETTQQAPEKAPEAPQEQQVPGNAPEAPTEQQEPETDPKQEMKSIMLPLDRDKPDVFVSLNGQNYQIKRGVEVEVPLGVYEILKNSEKMDQLAYTRRMKAMEVKKA